MVNSTDESYDPHARMHESFPRVDSGSDGSNNTQMAGDVVSFPQSAIGNATARLSQTLNEISSKRGYSQGTEGDNIKILNPFKGKQSQ